MERLLSRLADRPTPDRFDRVIEALMIGLLAFMPLAFGAVQAWSEQVVIVLAAAVSLTLLLKLLMVRTIPFVWSWAYVPVAILVLAAVVQLIPLPTSFVGTISPSTAALKADLLSDLPEPGGHLSSMTLSFYPRATRHDLRLMMAVAAVFVVIVNVYRTPEQIKRLLAAIAAIGGGIALLALAQDLAGNGKIYWVVSTYDGAHSGTFVNHSHYGQFMNLSIGAALALLFVKLREAFRGYQVTPAAVADYLRSSGSVASKILAAVVVLGAATVFVSLTRGGMVSMLIATAFTALLLSARRSLRGQGWIMVLLALAVFIGVLWVGFDQVYDRLATLRDFHQVQGSRLQILRDIALAWTRFPVFGVGLGTHEVVYPMFDRSTIAELARHAENEYAQAAEEMGALGLAALVLFGIIVWSRFVRSLRAASSIHAAAYGLGFGLLAVLIHSLSDFGQHLPANAMLSAVFCGLLIVLARLDRRQEVSPVRAPGWMSSACRLTVLALVGGVWTWAVLGANDARAAESHWNEVLATEHHLDQCDWLAPPQAYEHLFQHATAAVTAEPDNIHYRHWLGVYKWLSLTPYLDPNTHQLQAEALPWARQIVDELHQARPLCPTFGVICCVAGQIEAHVLHDPNGAERVRRGYRLAPCDPTACYAAARIDAREDDATAAFQKLTRAVELDGEHFRKAAQVCIDEMRRPDLALTLAAGDSRRLAQVSDLLARADGATASLSGTSDGHDGRPHAELAEQAQVLAFEQLKVRCEQPDAPAYAHVSLANGYRQRRDLEAAIRHYRLALRLDYDQVGWRYALAQALAQSGRLEEAMHEATVCLRLRPDHAAARRLAADLETRLLAASHPLSLNE